MSTNAKICSSTSKWHCSLANQGDRLLLVAIIKIITGTSLQGESGRCAGGTLFIGDITADPEKVNLVTVLEELRKGSQEFHRGEPYRVVEPFQRSMRR
jgi:hypothetical protein